MKIYVFNSKHVFKYLILLLLVILLAFAVSITGTGSVGAFSAGRELPIYSVEASEKVAAITFDCAWGADDIPAILETLAKENIKASFFLVGQWAEKFPDAVEAIAHEGHDIANHSYSHLRMGALDRSRVASEIQKCSDSLSQITGGKVELFRAPYGDYSNNLVVFARELGYYTIQWNVDSLDWKPGISAEIIKSWVTQKITPGSVILFHNATPHTSEVLPDIIGTLKKDGYSFLPVSRLILRDNFIIDAEGRQRHKK